MRIKGFARLAFLLGLSLLSQLAFAHCDTMDGPVVADARRAIEQSNVNFVLKWVKPEQEAELSEAFRANMNVKDLSPEAKRLAEKYFFETVVRLHRLGEGMPYTGSSRREPRSTRRFSRPIKPSPRELDAVAGTGYGGPAGGAQRKIRNGPGSPELRRRRRDRGPCLHRSLCSILSFRRGGRRTPSRSGRTSGAIRTHYRMDLGRAFLSHHFDAWSPPY